MQPLTLSADASRLFDPKPVLLLLGGLTLAVPARAGALEDYVNEPDSRFAWKQVDQRPAQDFTVTHLELVSQQWRGLVWRHHLQIVRPRQVRHPEFAFLFITGDGDGAGSLGLLEKIAGRSGALAAVVTSIPNQPLYGGRREDALIAYTFDRYLKTGDATWPLLFPMAKGAVRAMDALGAWAQQQQQPAITRFVLSGASKRGWTTWLAGAVDSRVKGIAPMVFDMLNMKAQTEWTAQVYGRQSERIRDYTELGLIAKMDDPRMVTLRRWVDPYSYRQRYTMPKLILLGTNDPYWTVEALRHYWAELPEPKLVFQTPNAGHDLGGGAEATQTLAAFVQMIADRRPLPQVTWKFNNDSPASLSVTANQSIQRIRLWSAGSADRDFRDAKWTTQREVTRPQFPVALPLAASEQGYRAFLAELVLTTPTGPEYKLSTAARVYPHTSP